MKRLKSKFYMTEKYILRDYLAMERTTLANERTLFSYIRMALYLVLAAIAFLKLESFESLRWLAYFMFVLSAFLMVFGFLRYQIMQKKLDNFYNEMQKEQKEN